MTKVYLIYFINHDILESHIFNNNVRTKLFVSQNLEYFEKIAIFIVFVYKKIVSQTDSILSLSLSSKQIILKTLSSMTYIIPQTFEFNMKDSSI